jgi:hypothetical protein
MELYLKRPRYTGILFSLSLSLSLSLRSIVDSGEG